MSPIDDVDAHLFLSVLTACKRRPAQLTEIVSAAAFLGCPVISATAWSTAFSRLTEAGLIMLEGDGFALTDAGLSLSGKLPKKAEIAERTFLIREQLSAYGPVKRQAPIAISTGSIDEALQAHLIISKQGGKNLLMPKPKAEERGSSRHTFPSGRTFKGRRGRS
jgi:hypothetical protein